MNKIIKISLVLLTFIGFVSCDSSDDDTSYLNDRTSVSYFVPGSSGTLLVEDGVTSTFNVMVGISEPKAFDRAFTYSIDPSSTVVNNADYTISSTLNIPANSVVGSISVTGDYAASTLEGKTLKLVLDSVDDSAIGARKVFTLTIIRYCPLEAPFTGSYMLQNISGGIPAAGFAPAFGNNVLVSLVQGAEDTDRKFNVKAYPSFNFSNPPRDVLLSFVCGNVIFNGLSGASGVGCGGSIAFGPATTHATYDPANDTVITINFTENTESMCGNAPAQSVIRLTKQ